MGQALFYHLVRRPVDVALTELLSRSLDRGWRVTVRAPGADRLDWLDKKLWLGPDDGFLPHGIAGGPHDALQPVLLTMGDGGADRQVLMALDGAEISAEDVAAHDRACLLFAADDAGDVQQARGQWKRLTDAGCAAQYWSDESGRWEMKAERAAD